MLRSMTARQFYEWLEFESVEPFGEARADARAGMVVQLLANVHRDRAVHPAAFTLEECVPYPRGDAFIGARVARKQSWQQMKAIAMLMSSASWEEN